MFLLFARVENHETKTGSFERILRELCQKVLVTGRQQIPIQSDNDREVVGTGELPVVPQAICVLERIEDPPKYKYLPPSLPYIPRGGCNCTLLATGLNKMFLI